LCDEGSVSCGMAVSGQVNVSEHGNVSLSQYGGTGSAAVAAEQVVLGSYHYNTMSSLNLPSKDFKGEHHGSLKIHSDNSSSQTSQLSCILSMADDNTMVRVAL
jgi:hypothetical protein